METKQNELLNDTILDVKFLLLIDSMEKIKQRTITEIEETDFINGYISAIEFCIKLAKDVNNYGK
jgi:hypothetical protein